MQHCVQTVVAHRAEVWSVGLNPEQDLLLSGSNEGELKAWKIEPGALAHDIKGLQNREVRCFSRIVLHLMYPVQLSKAIHPVSTLPLSSPNRVSQITFHPTLPYLFVQSNDRSVEVFRVRTDEEIRKKQARRRKRGDAKAALSKTEKASAVADNGDVEKIELADLFVPYLVVRTTGKIISFAFPEETHGKDVFQVRFRFCFFLEIRPMSPS